MFDIYYARHVDNWPSQHISGSTIEYLYQQKAIGICFDGGESWDPQDYTGQGPSALGYMNSCNEESENKYIFVSYKMNGGTKVLLGKPKQASKCFLSEHLRVETNEEIKLLFLEDDARIVTPGEFPFVFFLAPKQSTFVRWRQCSKIANIYINNGEYDLFDPDSYLPWAIEILCEEYLRRKGLMSLKVYKSGGSLKDFDIVGLGPDGRRIAAQVKNRSSLGTVKKFAKKCSAVGDGLYYFFVEGVVADDGFEDARIIALSEVLKEFSEEQDYLRRLQSAQM